MHTVLRVTLASVLAVALQAGFGVLPTPVAAQEGDCSLPSPICAKEGIVFIAPHANRLVRWRRETDFHTTPASRAASVMERAGTAQTLTLLMGPKDLTSSTYAGLIEAIIDHHGAVLVTNPTRDDAAMLDELTGLSGSSWSGDVNPRFYGVRSVLDPAADRSISMSFAMFTDHPERHGYLTDGGVAYLTGYLSRTPPPLLDSASAACADASQTCINSLAMSDVDSAKYSTEPDQTKNQSTIELSNITYGARSFEDNPEEHDYFLVLQELDTTFCPNLTLSTSNYHIDITNTPVAVPYTTLDATPTTDSGTTTVTSGSSYSIGGSTGYDSGLTADVTGSLDYSSSTSIGVPPIKIQNLTDVGTGVTQWKFTPTDFNNLPGHLVTTDATWIWGMDLGIYNNPLPDGPYNPDAVFEYESKMRVDNVICGTNAYDLAINMTPKIAQPFPTETVESPVVSSVSPASVAGGQEFTIYGSGFYPSTVSAVELGGNALDSSNWIVNSDEEITVVAPDNTTGTLSVIVKTSAGLSNSTVNVTLTD